MSYYKVTCHLDGSGVYYDPHEPPHIDALMAWVLAPMQGIRHVDRSTPPSHVRLPIKSSVIDDSHVYHASALFPEGREGEAIWYWRKRFRQSRAELATGSPNLTMGTYRDWQMPLPLLMCHRLIGYVHGKRKEIRKCLEQIRYFGKKRAHGHGRVIRWEIEKVDHDWSLTKDGIAMRFLPDPDGVRMGRVEAPYWHPMGRVRVCEVGGVAPASAIALAA